MTPDPAAIARHREALRRVVVERPDLTVQEAYAAAQEAMREQPVEPSVDQEELTYRFNVIFRFLASVLPGMRP